MKLHISYNFPDIETALSVAEQTAEYADIIGVGSLLIYKEGIKAIKTFKAKFPTKDICAEIAIMQKAQDTVTMFSHAGASYISVLAGTFHGVVKKAVETAKRLDINITLDLLDAHSPGQSALDAKTLGVNLLIIHQAPTPTHPTEPLDLFTEWQNVRENTNLPVFVAGKIDRTNIAQVLELRPQGVIIGTAITHADNPKKEAQYFQSLM